MLGVLLLTPSVTSIMNIIRYLYLVFLTTTGLLLLICVEILMVGFTVIVKKTTSAVVQLLQARMNWVLAPRLYLS